jgi:hypothetical protein
MADEDRRRLVEVRAKALRDLLAGRRDVTEKRMFGGLTFMVADHMCCGATSEDLVFRVGPDRYREALRAPHARVCDFTGKPLKGMVMVSFDAAKSPGALDTWVRWSLEFVSSLPPKR